MKNEVCKQGYILRYYLPVKPYFDEDYTEKRFTQLLDFCKRASVDAVMLYVALSPDFYYVPDTPAYAEQVRAQMLPYIDRLKAAGISYQLNFQNLVGATLGGADFSSVYEWEKLVDYKGQVSTGCGCLLGEKFRADATKRLQIWAETKPDIIWIDDDLRYHNHGTPIFSTLEGKPWYMDFYCFCDKHIARFNQEQSSAYTRESLLEEMLKDASVRNAYLKFLGTTMNETASWIEKAIHEVSPNTKVALMTGWADAHAAEGREWANLLPALCGEYTPITRPHFGPYQEQVPMDFVNCYRYLDQIIAQIAQTYNGKVEYCPEVENTRFTAWAKSAAATSFQLALSAFMGCKDITLSLYDLEGGALFDEPLYEEMLVKEKPFLDKLVALQLSDAERLGIKIPTSESSAKSYVLAENQGFSELLGGNRYIENYLLKMGVPCHFATPNDCEKGGIVVLDAFSAGFLTDEQLRNILLGKVFMDGGAAEVLLRRDFGEYIGVIDMAKQKVLANVEVIKNMSRADGTHIRIPIRTPENSWYKTNVCDDVEILSTFSTPTGESIPAMMSYKNAYGGNIAIYPAVNRWGDGFFTHHRVAFFKNLFEEMDAALPRVDVSNKSMLVVKKKADKTYYFYANLSTDLMREIKINGTTLNETLHTYQSIVYEEYNGEYTKIGKTTM